MRTSNDRLPLVFAALCALTVAAAYAQPASDDFDDGVVDSSWTLVGVGNANQLNAVEVSGVLELTADGATAFAGPDNAGFLYRPVTGDFRAEVTVDGSTMATGGPFRKAGLMLRDGLDPDAVRLMATLVPFWDNGSDTHIQFIAREAYAGSGRETVAADVVGVPRVLQLAIERLGDTVRVEYSVDGGVTWIQPTSGLGGSVALPALGETVLIGLTVVSNDISITSTAHFDDFHLDAAAPVEPLVITGAEPSFDTDLMLISGRGLGDAVPFTGTVQLFTPQAGSIELTVAGFDPIAQELLVDLPADLDTTPGTFLLSVAVGEAALQSDSFDVTFGAVGPQGPPGPPGPQGEPGPSGSAAITVYFCGTNAPMPRGQPEYFVGLLNGCTCPSGVVIAGGGACTTGQGIAHSYAFDQDTWAVFCEGSQGGVPPSVISVTCLEP